MIAADTLALEGIDVEVVNCRQIKPLPDRMLEKYAYLPIVTLEENSVIGGFGALVSLRYEQLGHSVRLLPVGIGDEFVQHGTRTQLLKDSGLDASGICDKIREFIGA